MNQLDRQFTELKRAILENEYGFLNKMQQSAVFTAQGPLLILAGAGSGKTTVVINRIAYIIKYGNAYCAENSPEAVTKENVDLLERYLATKDPALADKVRMLIRSKPCPSYGILAITFTNKAAEELKNRLEKALGAGAGEIWASTFHSFCARVLRRDADKLGYSRDFGIYDTDDSVRLMKDVIKAQQIDEKMFPPKAVLSTISRAKDSLITPDAFVKELGGDYRMQKIGKLYEAYQRRLKEANALDFDDLIMQTAVLFRDKPEVLEYYAKRFQYISVDEYQDTNVAQYKLVASLASYHKNLCVVGDDDQSIYKFRGATIENILMFEDRFDDVKTIRLEQNYRSTKTILDAANAVIENNVNRKGKTLWTENQDGEKIRLHKAADEADEGYFIAQTVLEGAANGRAFSDFAVLYRMNAQSNNIEKAFVKSGIPYKIIGGIRFYERKEIKDVLSYLCVIQNHNDSVRLLRIINEPSRKIGEATISKLKDISGETGKSVFEVIHDCRNYPQLSSAADRLEAFAVMIDELYGQQSEKGMAEFFELVLDKTGYMNMLQLQNNDEAEDRIRNINELLSNIVEYEKKASDPTWSGFLEEVALISDIDNYSESSDYVVLMTLHSAKGLEFPVVFIPGMEEGIFPGMQSIFEPANLEEERRLMYVGITRAKQRLYLIHTTCRMLFGHTTYNKISRFAEEIPKKYCETDSLLREKDSFGAGHHSAPKAAVPPIFVGTKPEKKSPPAVAETFCEGERVHHNTFGDGTISSVKPMAGDTLLAVNFDSVGPKKLMATYAKLKKIQ